MRVAIQGDIGQPVYHVGDEAMTHAVVAELSRRRVTDLVLLTRDVAHSRHHFGQSVGLARTLEFPWEPAARERYLGEIKAVMAGERGALPPEDQVFRVIETIRGVDALVIAGGGNLNSRYGWLLYERAATAHIAVALGKPVVITGQTLGPELSPTDRDTLAELLGDASLVGLREDASFGLAERLSPGHPGLRACLDDAVLLPDPSPAPPPATPAPIAATFASPAADVDRAEAARAYARLLDAVALRLGAPIAFLPHMATPGLGDGDEAFHAEVASHLVAPHTLHPIGPALKTARATREARAVVTSRYHPVVFAGAAGVPAVGIAPDAYSHVRIAGGLARLGVHQPVPDLADLLRVEDFPADWLETLDGALPPPALAAAHTAWWDTVVAALPWHAMPAVEQFVRRLWLRRLKFWRLRGRLQGH